MSNCAAPRFDSPAQGDGARRDAPWRIAANALGSLARRALPQCCALCAAPSGERLVCLACAAALPRIAHGCPCCALPTLEASLCGACLREAPPYAATIAVFVYAFPVDRLLQRLKYASALALADWAAGELAAAVVHGSNRLPGVLDALVPLPLAPARQRARGFNQAHEIARGVSSRLGIPTQPLLARVRETAPQASLRWSARRANVKHAFAAARPIGPRNLAIVDDVMTTGATLREAARALLASGAASVTALVVARTLSPGANDVDP